MDFSSDRVLYRGHLQSAFISRKYAVLETEGFAVSVSQAESQSSPYLGHHSGDELESSRNHPIQQPRIPPVTTDLVRNFDWPNPPTEMLHPSTKHYTSRRRWVLSTPVLVCIIILVTLLSIVVGVLVGVFTRNASLGIAATSAIAAILSSIAGTLILRSRRHDQ
ncbi:hypothetical protein GJ744_003341 [Endocarpon pusillum]|uniref:Uncharacterized protein n=1 Tax=Endocarpon pusillum TaxID=364733 RepID=A0A8H7AAV8_9EURO|nr:hypothetical protein GJ744_003341 [Endocarpon pusillum]